MSEQIKSQSDLFPGMMIDKPQRALVVGYDPEEGDIYACPYCSHQATADACDILGCEPGCLSCLNCSREFKAWDEDEDEMEAT